MSAFGFSILDWFNFVNKLAMDGSHTAGSKPFITKLVSTIVCPSDQDKIANFKLRGDNVSCLVVCRKNAFMGDTTRMGHFFVNLV